MFNITIIRIQNFELKNFNNFVKSTFDIFVNYFLNKSYLKNAFLRFLDIYSPGSPCILIINVAPSRLSYFRSFDTYTIERSIGHISNWRAYFRKMRRK